MANADNKASKIKKVMADFRVKMDKIRSEKNKIVKESAQESDAAKIEELKKKLENL